MQSTKSKTVPTPPYAELRRTEAAKTSRLRALRLAKEAEDREAAARAVVSAPPKAAVRRRVRAAADTVKPEIGLNTPELDPERRCSDDSLRFLISTAAQRVLSPLQPSTPQENSDELSSVTRPRRR